MLPLVEKLSLPFLALCLFGTIIVMAWIIFRPDPHAPKIDAGRDDVANTPVRPSGPLTAIQRTALSRRRRLAR